MELNNEKQPKEKPKKRKPIKPKKLVFIHATARSGYYTWKETKE